MQLFEGGFRPDAQPSLFVLPTSLCEFPKHTTAFHYRYDMQMYCTFVLFVNQHFLGLPASGTHCAFCVNVIVFLPFYILTLLSTSRRPVKTYKIITSLLGINLHIYVYYKVTEKSFKSKLNNLQQNNQLGRFAQVV
jgi:hypothetical protein